MLSYVSRKIININYNNYYDWWIINSNAFIFSYCYYYNVLYNKFVVIISYILSLLHIFVALFFTYIIIILSFINIQTFDNI